MRKIHLVSVYLEAFKSFKSPTTVNLSIGPGFKYLGGINKARPNLGANGVGKSSLWDGVLWCFYGIGAKGQRANELVSWGLNKPIVRCELLIDDITALVERQGNPNRLLLDGKLVDQERVNLLLGLSRVRFQHSVIYGQAVQLFPDLSVPERANLLDEVCDLGIWLQATEEVNKELNRLDRHLDTTLRTISNAEGQLQAIKATNIVELQEQADDWDAKRIQDKRTIQYELKQSVSQYNAAVNAMEKARANLVDAPAVDVYDSRISSLREHVTTCAVRIQSNMDTIKRFTNEVEFFQLHDQCIVCKHELTEDFRHDRIASLETSLHYKHKSLKEDKLKQLDYKDDLETLSRNRDKLFMKRNQLFSDRDIAVALCGQKQRENGALEKRLASLSGPVENPFQARLLSLEALEQSANEQFSDAQSAQSKIKGQLGQLDYWKTGFKKVRLYLVERVLNYLTIETEAASQALGLKGWRIEYVTEVETKSGTMKPGVQIIVKSSEVTGTWDSWSGGESQRLRLAIAMGLSTLIQQMAGVEYSWEVYDEPSSWLSSEGIDDMLGHFKYRADSLNKSIWLVDHRALNATSFDEIWYAVKKRAGTTIERVS